MRLAVASLGLALASTSLTAQVVRYEVSFPDRAARLIHVRADFPAAGRDTLRVSLPAWSPGSYEIENYARYVRHFGAQGPTGAVLFWDRLDKDTWRIPTGGAERVSIEFDFLADTIDLSLPRVRDEGGWFLGTNVFLFEEGQINRPAEVRFTVPEGWRVTTALRPGTAGLYTAADYHELADAMTFAGRHAVDSLQVDGKWLRIAVSPASAYTPAASRSLRNSVTRLAQVQNRIMGGPPYDVYTVFFAVISEPINFAGGLEHTYSHFNVMPVQGFADAAGNLGDFMNPLMSHEFFHLWNVKRIRPAELWPYDYAAEQYTPLLWWSEGVTDYYADVSNLRAGLWTEREFAANVQSNAGQVDGAPEPWSAEDGSVATWIDEVYVPSSQLYYPKGSLLGLLLDISIRDATDNAKSLDQVMRGLYDRFYRQGKGFRTADLLALLREAGMPEFEAFYQKYVNGREPLPYEEILPRAGFVVERRTVTSPVLGVAQTPTAAGMVVTGVDPSSAAAAADVRPGDLLVRVGDVTVTVDADWGAEFRRRYQGRAGQPLTIVVRRDGRALTLTTEVRERTRSTVAVTRAATLTPKQGRVWRGIATGN
jgi:predicted metalloprotease with PDZ domain